MTTRARKTGRYTYEIDRACARCGATLGNHEAEAPHAQSDLSMGPECEGFRPEKQKKAG